MTNTAGPEKQINRIDQRGLKFFQKSGFSQKTNSTVRIHFLIEKGLHKNNQIKILAYPIPRISDNITHKK